MSLNQKFAKKIARVKGISFHPTRPWILVSLHTGQIQIWDHNIQIKIVEFDEAEGPVRSVNFHPHLPIFVSGADNGNVRVWNYKQKRCQFILKGHVDYIRTAVFHLQLPWILSASDDQTMRIWNYQNRCCVNIIAGHSHYVMCAQFHHQKKLIISGSLDGTIRIWDYSILSKRISQSRNAQGFIGIQIQCIKILQGHYKGVNWVCFHPKLNVIASASDDKSIKIWKFVQQTAWQHTSIFAHRNNVSCLIYDPITEDLISNSQDKTLKIWNTQSKSAIITQKKPGIRFWMLAIDRNAQLMAAGHDDGFSVYHLHRKIVPNVMISKDCVVYAQKLNIVMYNIKQKKQTMEGLNHRQKGSIFMAFIQNIISCPFSENLFVVEGNQWQNNQRYYCLKSKKSNESKAVQISEYSGISTCFASQNILIQLSNPKNFNIVQFHKSTLKKVAFTEQNFMGKKVFSGKNKNQFFLIASHNNKLYRLNITELNFKDSYQLQDSTVKSVLQSPHPQSQKIAILHSTTIVIISSSFQFITKITQRQPIKQVFWDGPEVLFYVTVGHLKYAFMNGQTGVLRTIQQPLSLLRKLQNNGYLVFNKTLKIHEMHFPDYSEIQLKKSISLRDIQAITNQLKKRPQSKKQIIIKQLVNKGLSNLALTLLPDSTSDRTSQQKFSLAIHSSNFQLAFQICNKKNSPDYWKMLGEQALRQGVYEAYELACQKLKNFSDLWFLYSLQGNREKMGKLMKVARKGGNLLLAFNTNIWLNNSQNYQQILREAGLQALASLSRQAHNSQNPDKESALFKGSSKLRPRPLTPAVAVGRDNLANWPHVQ